MARSGSGDGEKIFSPGMHAIEIVVIRCYFNSNFILMIMILMNKVVRHILFVYLCSCTSIGNIWKLFLFVYRFISETYSE